MIESASASGRYRVFAIGLAVCLVGVVGARLTLSGLTMAGGQGTTVSISPASLVFGSSPQNVTVTNNGSTTLRLGQIRVVGVNAGDFSNTTTCGNTLAAGAHCAVSVKFIRKARGVRSGSLLFSDDSGGSSQTVGLIGAGGQLMVLDPTKTYLMNTFTNKPVFITGDSAFNLATQLSANSDIDTFLSDRASRGFNFIWVAVVDNAYHDPKGSQNNASGQNPWSGGADFTNENEAYFEHVDYVVQRAATYGITVLMGTAFAGAYGGCNESGGYCPEIEAASDAMMTAYGEYLGNRYKSYPNIVWLIGGDSDIPGQGSALQNKLNDLATGIKSADRNHLMTVEEDSDGPTNNAYTYWHGYPWFDLNAIYPKQAGWYPPTCIMDAAAQASAAYAHGLPPAFSMEDVYETEGGISNLWLRQEAYTEVLNGAYLGRLFGSSAIWPFGARCCTPKGYTWQTDIHAAPSVHQQYFGQLFRSREHWKMVPDISHAVVTAGYGSGATLTVTSRTNDGQTIIAYIPNGKAATLTVDMSKITSSSNTAKCWWFNPSSSATTLIGTYANSGTQKFTPPDSDDWVLVIDDAGANLPAPGSADL